MATKLQDSLVRKIQENRELKDTIKDLHAQSERDKEFYKGQLQEVQDESNNLELALKKCILSKAELNDKIEQLQDDLEKYVELYASTKIVAQALGEAVYYLTKEKNHG
jgi:predicted nuclease with TOPRIM domain